MPALPTLFLRLEGPLQAWGLRARWGERDTATEPTKSGIVGLLGCALGLHRADRELQTISAALRMGVRVDLPGRLLRDYHTTGGGRFGSIMHHGGTRFHDQTYAGGVLSPEVVKGRIKVKVNATTKEPETDTSDRYYLSDASFLAALQGPQALIERLAAAVQAPIWPYFLGRKACVPAAPVFAATGMYDDLQSALSSQSVSARVDLDWERRGVPDQLRLLLETRPNAGNRQNDNIGTPAQRIFLPRYVREAWIDTALLPGVSPPDAAPPTIDTLEG